MGIALIPGDVLKAFSAKEVQFSKQQLSEVVNKFDSDGMLLPRLFFFRAIEVALHCLLKIGNGSIEFEEFLELMRDESKQPDVRLLFFLLSTFSFAFSSFSLFSPTSS